MDEILHVSNGLESKQRHLIGILADAHGNFPAFDRAITILRDLGVESFWFLGDAVGYIPSLRVIASIRELGTDIRCIRGNHEQMLLSDNFDAARDSVYQISILKANIKSEDITFIITWGLLTKEKFGFQSALLVHGSPINPTVGYVYPNSDLSIFQPGTDIVFMGHCHRPFIRDCNGVKYVNVGSCGLPRDDGRFGSAAIYDPANGEVRVVRFDITAETNSVLAENPHVHQSVRDVLARRNESIFGDFV